MAGVRLYPRPGVDKYPPMLLLEKLVIPLPHLPHRLRPMNRTEGAMELVMDPHPGKRQLVMGELRAILEV
jgi:hypothetical protein